MATDATGVATSPDSIPTYNTSVDAPSGLGFNAAMAAIQTALSARASKPAGIVSGEVPVWNGATWVRSSVTNVGPTSLGSGTPDATKFLRGDGSWQVPSPSVALELDYVEKTSATTINTTSEAAAVTVVTGSAVVYDGSTKARIEFFAPSITIPAGLILTLVLFDGSTPIGQLALIQNQTASTMNFGGGAFVRELTPAAATKTYSVRGYLSGAGSGFIQAGAGGAGAYVPNYLRQSKAA